MKKSLLTIAAIAIIVACKKEDPLPTPPPSGFGSGVFITNEGVFNTGEGTLSFYDRNNQSTDNGIFMDANGVPVGNILQSANQLGPNLYLVVNNSQKVVVADAATMEQKAEITGLQSPRYIHFVSGSKAYITDWLSNTVAILDVLSNTITGTIPTGNSPERMVQRGNRVFVANSGAFGKDSTVTVINAITDQVESTIQTGYNPQSLQIDVNGNLWILCRGYADWQDPTNDVAGKLMQIDMSTFSVMKELDFPNQTDHPAQLSINKDGIVLYFLSDEYGGSAFEMNISQPTLPTSPLISGAFRNIDVDPLNNELYIANMGSNTQGTVYRYNPNGSLIDSMLVGIFPSNFLFR